jgi:hypothetical protein
VNDDTSLTTAQAARERVQEGRNYSHDKHNEYNMNRDETSRRPQKHT